MSNSKQISTFRKVLAAVALLVVIVGSMFLGFYLATGGRSQEGPPSLSSGYPEESPVAKVIVFSVVLAVMSVIALFVGAALYAVVVITRLFTFDFTRPVWSSFKSRLFLANTFVPLPIQFGLSGLVSAIGSPLLAGLGVDTKTAFAALLFAPFVLLQFISVWVNIWMPLQSRLARSRLLAIGVEPARMKKGILLGISDPAKKSLRKFGLIEEDIGMLWIRPDELVYQGDNDAFRVRREELISIERVADPGSVSAYFGNVHIILTFNRSQATPRRVRLHPESSWTLTGTANASDRLAKELEGWKGAGT